MKMLFYLSFSMVGIFVASTGVHADPAPVDPADSPYLQTDPDGVPISIAPGQNYRPTQDEINAERKQEEQAALDKNWLLRNYERQLKIHALSDASDHQDTNLYYQLSSNKDLAKLADLPELTPDNQDDANSPTYRTGSASSAPTSAKLRPDGSTGTPRDFLAHGDLLKPLITPLSAPDAAGLHGFYASLPTSMASPLARTAPQQSAPMSVEDQSPDGLDMETPGMVAAEKDPLKDPAATDLTLDILPGETIEQARAEQQDKTKLELPAPMDVDQLHKSQAADLTVPGVQSVTQTPTPAPVASPAKVVPVNEEDAPVPISKEPTINPVRSPIANPYDILDR